MSFLDALLNNSASQAAIARRLVRDYEDYTAIIGFGAFAGGWCYAIYLGEAARALTVDYLRLHVQTAGAGAQVAELAIGTTPTGPDFTNKTITVAAVSPVEALTATGVRRNTNALGHAAAAGDHLWALLRVDMAVTEPTQVRLLTCDHGRGGYQSLASAAELTVGATVNTTITSSGYYFPGVVAE